MIDEENPNIEYRQANLSQIAIFILFISLLILGDLVLIIYFASTVAEYGMNNTAVITLIATIYVLLSLAVNLFVVSMIVRYKYDDHPILYTVLTFVSLNIPCGIMMLVKRAKEKEEIEEEE